MAGPEWPSGAPLTEELPLSGEHSLTLPPDSPTMPLALEDQPAVRLVIERGHKKSFLAVMGVLERMTPHAPRVGGLGPVVEEMIRFRHDIRLQFAAGDVASVELKHIPSDPTDQLSPPRPLFEVSTTFLGLTGSSSPLASYFLEEVLFEDADEPAQRDFLDLFHHRLISLFYRVSTRCNALGEHQSDQSDSWSKRLLSLGGFDTYDRPYGGRLPAWRLLRLTPLLARNARTAEALRIAVKDTFGIELGDGEVDVQQFVGGRIPVEPEQRMRLGLANGLLGHNAVLGARIFDRASKFRVKLGPLGYETYRKFLPGGDHLSTLKELVSLFCRDPLDYDVELTLATGSKSTFRLGGPKATKLGTDSWLGSASHQETKVIVEVSQDSEADRESDSAVASAARSRIILATSE
ncbi:MAG: type VI secretion system baseplate subunit TssG [Deltaproteobacteria bacterium]|nr:type VI secretion system baseplate subunit TssG [Deltaproteobacteria bacterium]